MSFQRQWRPKPCPRIPRQGEPKQHLETQVRIILKNRLDGWSKATITNFFARKSSNRFRDNSVYVWTPDAIQRTGPDAMYLHVSQTRSSRANIRVIHPIQELRYGKLSPHVHTDEAMVHSWSRLMTLKILFIYSISNAAGLIYISGILSVMLLGWSISVGFYQ